MNLVTIYNDKRFSVASQESVEKTVEGFQERLPETRSSAKASKLPLMLRVKV